MAAIIDFLFSTREVSRSFRINDILLKEYQRASSSMQVCTLYGLDADTCLDSRITAGHTIAEKKGGMPQIRDFRKTAARGANYFILAKTGAIASKTNTATTSQAVQSAPIAATLWSSDFSTWRPGVPSLASVMLACMRNSRRTFSSQGEKSSNRGHASAYTPMPSA